MTADPRFLSIDDVLRLHVIAIEDQGGDPSVRDRGLLESALAMPRQQFGGAYLHPDIPSMAAAYAFHICMNHPFIDGNKRAAVAAMIAFLSDNGWSFDVTTDEAEPIVLSLAATALSKPALTDWLRSHAHEKPSLELRDFLWRLHLDTVHDFLVSITQPLRMPELDRTAREASEHIPLVRRLFELSREHYERDDRPSGASLGNQAMLLVALYRIAEDMGYEW